MMSEESPLSKHQRKLTAQKHSRTWFEVDKEGLAKILRRKGLAFIAYELVQNALDTGARHVEVTLEPVPHTPKVWVRVEDDDPEGFKDLSHAWTLFAESDKKGDPTKRGRFNLGEKLVLAVCEEAEIRTTKGTVFFREDDPAYGARGFSNQMSACTKEGSIFRGLVKMTRAELAEVQEALKLILPSETCDVRVNGELLPSRKPLAKFEVTLPTEVADEEGYLRKSARKTTINVYPRQGDVCRLFEMGIPVVEVDLPWNVEVMQKIPLNSDRDNVTPAYARELGVAVVNHMHKFLKPEDAVQPGVQEALGDTRIEVEAVQTILTHQHGTKRAILDPRAKESNAQAFSEGYVVLGGGSYSKDQWANIRRAEGALPTSTLFPIKEVYDPEGNLASQIPEADWSPGMRNVAAYAQALAKRVIDKDVVVRFENRTLGSIDLANYGRDGGRLCFNVGRLGFKWFDKGINVAVNDLLIHEFAHEYGDHLTKKFDDGLSSIGAKMVALAVNEPEFFLKYGFVREPEV